MKYWVLTPKKLESKAAKMQLSRMNFFILAIPIYFRYLRDKRKIFCHAQKSSKLLFRVNWHGLDQELQKQK